jgi:multicomponent Na+:H+ antiporter subunit G
VIEFLSLLLIYGGIGFYIAGTVGLLRLPDLYSRLHALTKADNLGLGLLVAGLLLRSDDLLTASKLLLVWVLVLTASAAGSQLIAQFARRSEREAKS